MKILFKFASRSRPHKFFNAMDNICQLTKTEFKVLGTFDEDDSTMNNHSVIEKLNTYKNLIYFFGRSQHKIDAINRDMDKSGEWDILVNMSDDMRFIKEGFDIDIISDMQTHFPDGFGVLHYPDGYRFRELMTMSIMDRAYFNRFGYIYHPSYISLWCDDEATKVAKMLQRLKYIEKHLFVHEHPANGKGQVDEQYRRTEKHFLRDHQNYVDRKSRNFDLKV